MQTNLAEWARDSLSGKEAEEILRRCVHCGFCLATCPTYEITGDERDSPRGRIYLIKEMLEDNEPGRSTQFHLDRCLTCRNCETTCPSGVEYGKLVDIGRDLVEERVARPRTERLSRLALRRLINSALFGPAFRLGRAMRPILPEALGAKLAPPRAAGSLPANTHTLPRQVLLLAGCVQPTLEPAIDAATRRVLARLGVGVQVAAESGCCGAVNFHLNAQDAARDQMRANIDAWLPLIDSGKIEAIVMNASGCGAMVREYDHQLRHDPEYANKAARIVSYVMDVAEFIAPHAGELQAQLGSLPEDIAFHPPCTLQHWQSARGTTEKLLRELGFQLKSFTDPHLCCGAAGTYAMTQPEMSKQLRERKINTIEQADAHLVVSSNMGCARHLQEGTDMPVRHWIEIVDDALVSASDTATPTTDKSLP